MGLEKNKIHEKRDKSGGRGSVNNAGRLEAFASGDRASTADWERCSADKLKEMVVQITALGGAVIIGMARDRGAHSVTLLLDKSRKTLWFNGDAVLDDELDAINVTLGQM